MACVGAHLRLSSVNPGSLGRKTRSLGKRTTAAVPARLRASCRRCTRCAAAPPGASLRTALLLSRLGRCLRRVHCGAALPDRAHRSFGSPRSCDRAAPALLRSQRYETSYESSYPKSALGQLGVRPLLLGRMAGAFGNWGSRRVSAIPAIDSGVLMYEILVVDVSQSGMQNVTA